MTVTIDSGPHVPYAWPTREQWAEQQRCTYWNWADTGCPFSDKFGHRLSDYATPEEIAALILAVENIWRELGRRMKQAKRVAGPLCQQPGETRTACGRRWHALPDGEDKDLAAEPDYLRLTRQEVNLALAELRKDNFPPRHIPYPEAVRILIAPFKNRYEIAFQAAEEEWAQQKAAVPIDDRAWQQELDRRERVAHYFIRD
jgi:hypothetical protein